MINVTVNIDEAVNGYTASVIKRKEDKPSDPVIIVGNSLSDLSEAIVEWIDKEYKPEDKDE